MLESSQRGDSNKYPKHMFCEEIRINETFLDINPGPVVQNIVSFTMPYLMIKVLMLR